MLNVAIWLLAMCVTEVITLGEEEWRRQPVVIAPTLLVGAPGKPGRRWLLSNRPVRLAANRPGSPQAVQSSRNRSPRLHSPQIHGPMHRSRLDGHHPPEAIHHVPQEMDYPSLEVQHTPQENRHNPQKLHRPLPEIPHSPPMLRSQSAQEIDCLPPEIECQPEIDCPPDLHYSESHNPPPLLGTPAGQCQFQLLVEPCDRQNLTRVTTTHCSRWPVDHDDYDYFDFEPDWSWPTGPASFKMDLVTRDNMTTTVCPTTTDYPITTKCMPKSTTDYPMTTKCMPKSTTTKSKTLPTTNAVTAGKTAEPKSLVTKEVRAYLTTESKMDFTTEVESSKSDVRETVAVASAATELGKLVSRLRGRALLRALASFSCSSTMSLPTSFCIPAPGARPRSTPSAPMPPGPRGPREISPDLFEDFIRRLPLDSVQYYVFPSTRVEIPCFSTGDVRLSPNNGDSTSYKWMHSNMKAITEGRIASVGGKEGSLVIRDVSLADSDSYTCTVSYIDPDTLRMVSRQFVHKLNALPQLSLQSNVHYTVQGPCDGPLLEALEMYLPQQIEMTLCRGGRLCTVHIHNPLCYTPPTQEDNGPFPWAEQHRRARWTNFEESGDDHTNEKGEVAALVVVKPVTAAVAVPEALDSEICGPHCNLKLALKMADLMKDALLDALSVPVSVETETDQGPIVLQPEEHSVDLKLLISCAGGLELRNGFCLPCLEQHFSEDGATECIPCPPGTYQDRVGSRSCVPCPHPFVSGCFPFSWLTTLILLSASTVTIFSLIRCCAKRDVFIGQMESYLRGPKHLSEECSPLVEMSDPSKCCIFSKQKQESFQNELEKDIAEDKPRPLPTDFE